MRSRFLFCLVFAACSSNVVGPLDGSVAADAHVVSDSGTDALTVDAPHDTGKPDAATLCHNVPKEENADRAVVISHPFAPEAGKSGIHEVLRLKSDATITSTGVTFTLGAPSRGNSVFTPDGAVGLVALEGGSVGSFTIDSDLKATVVDASFSGSFYAEKLIVSPDGASAWVLNPNTTENAGALVEIAIGCNGKLSETGRKIGTSSMFAGTIASTNPFQVLVGAKSVTGSQAGHQVHLLDLSTAAPSYVRGGTVFSDSDAIPSAMAIVGDHALIADDGIIRGDRIGVVDTKTLKPVQELVVRFPSAVVTSPFGNAVLAIASDTVAKIYALSYDKAKASPFTSSEMKYTLAKPSLPQFAAIVNRGALMGHAFITETTSVRQVKFDSSGNLTDASLFAFGSGIPNIVGSIGVQP